MRISDWSSDVCSSDLLAAALKDTPGIAAYNLINEPTPEKGAGLPEHSDAATMRAWYAKHRGTARDLPDLYRTLIAAIRSVDADTPLMPDAGWYAASDAFAYWPAPLAAAALPYRLRSEARPVGDVGVSPCRFRRS